MAQFVLSAFADEIDACFSSQLQGLNKLEINNIELRGVDGKPFTTLSDTEISSVKQQLLCNGITVSALGSPLGKAITSEKQNQIKLLERIIKIGNALNVNKVRMFSFYKEENDSDEAFEEKVFDIMGCLLALAEREGFILCHENEQDIYGYSKERVKKLADNFGGKLRLVQDNANYVYCNQEVEGSYELLKDYVEYFHIKDCEKNSVIVPVGKGLAQINKLLASVNSDRKGKVILTVEPHLMDFAGLSSLAREGSIKHAYCFDTPYSAFEYSVKLLRNMLSAL